MLQPNQIFLNPYRMNSSIEIERLQDTRLAIFPVPSRNRFAIIRDKWKSGNPEHDGASKR